jgi:transposase
MANHQRDPEKEAYWREVMERQRSSGLSVREFCRREGLSEPSLHAWRRTIARRDGSARPAKPRRAAPAFVPLVVKESPPRDTSIALELAGGCVLKFAGPMAAEQLAELVLALQGRNSR